jgi:hypothetical protein
MIKKQDWLCTGAMAALIYVSGCSAPAPTANEGGVSELAQAVVAATSSEYKLPASVDTDVLGDRMTELWARVYRPTVLEPDVRYPVLLFLHGNHPTCGHGSAPRIDDNNQYTHDGTCPAGYVVAPSHNGYGYIAGELASRGYIVVSVNANRGITSGAGVAGDAGLNLARGRLLLKHLATLSEWDRGVSASPASLGVDLTNHLDFSQVGLLGHSRGGEGARAAYAQYRDVGSPWPARIVTPVTFQGIFEIGPVDGQTSRVLDVRDTTWSVLLPLCDGDVGELAGVKPFDRAQAFTSESKPTFKSTLTAWGTNHNYYNTEWQASDALACFGVGNAALFSPLPGISGSPAQRAVGRILTAAFFRGNVGAAHDPTQNAIFDPNQALPEALTELTRVDRGYTPSPDESVSLRLEDFVNATGTSTFGQPNAANSVLVAHGALPEHDPSLRAARITWIGAANHVYFQTNFTAVGSGISLAAYDTLDLRLDLALSLLNLTPPADFSVQLVNAQNQTSVAQPISSFISLTGPAGGIFFAENGGIRGATHSMLQTARIPLSAFGMPLDAIRGVRLTFNLTALGSVYVANIRASKNAAPVELDAATSRAPSSASLSAASSAALPMAPQPAAPVASAAPVAPRSTASGRIVAIGETRAPLSVSGGTDIEVSSSTQFPVIDDLFVLHIGSVNVSVSRYPDPGDMQRLIFTLTAGEFAALRNGDHVSVSGGGTRWQLGQLEL